jgi:hypothetical protein
MYADGPDRAAGGVPGGATPGGSWQRGPSPAHRPVAGSAGPPPMACGARNWRWGGHPRCCGDDNAAHPFHDLGHRQLRARAVPGRAATVERDRQPAQHTASTYRKAGGAPIPYANRNFQSRAAHPTLERAAAKPNTGPHACAPHPAEPIQPGQTHTNPHSHHLQITNAPVAHRWRGSLAVARRPVHLAVGNHHAHPPRHQDARW